jgi:hypothetical protein
LSTPTSQHIHNAYIIPAQNLPSPRRLTKTFLRRLSLEVCAGELDLKDSLREDQLSRLDALFAGMRSTQRKRKDSTTMTRFPRSKTTLWTGYAKRYLEIEPSDGSVETQLAGLQLTMRGALIEQMVSEIWVDVGVAVAEWAAGDSTRADDLPGVAPRRALRYAGGVSSGWWDGILAKCGFGRCVALWWI